MAAAARTIFNIIFNSAIADGLRAVCYCIFTGEAARENCICGRFRFELFRNPFVFCGFMVYYRIRMRTNGLCARFFIKFSSNAIFGGVQPCIG